MGTIITISGVSGSGKTTLTEHLLSLGPQYRIVESVTTRQPRERDRPDEFLYLSPNEFVAKEQSGDFLWVTPPIHGTRYGTLRESVGKALTGNSISIMVITVECLSPLRFYATRDARSIIGLYVLSPGEAILRERLIKRGDAPPEIEKRIEECRDWDAQAREITEHPPINFLQNNGSLDDFFAEAKHRCAL